MSVVKVTFSTLNCTCLLEKEKLRLCGVENPADIINTDVPFMGIVMIQDYILGGKSVRDETGENYVKNIPDWAKRLGISCTITGVPIELFETIYRLYPWSSEYIAERIQNTLKVRDKLGLTEDEIVRKIDSRHPEQIGKILEKLVAKGLVIQDANTPPRYRRETCPDPFFLRGRMRTFLHPKNMLCANPAGLTLDEIMDVFDDHYNVHPDRSTVMACLQTLCDEGTLKRTVDDRFIRVIFGHSRPFPRDVILAENPGEKN